MSQGDSSSGEIKLFGVIMRADPMRKCASLNSISQYQPPAMRRLSNNINLNAFPSLAANTGYVSADNLVRNLSYGRKRGIPWTEYEHNQFLKGLQELGRGDWRGISRKFVKTRIPTQVASHAQKYFLRQTNPNRGRRRPSLFDITTVAAVQAEEQVSGDQVISGSNNGKGMISVN